jgi:hypothetical protein
LIDVRFRGVERIGKRLDNNAEKFTRAFFAQGFYLGEGQLFPAANSFEEFNRAAATRNTCRQWVSASQSSRQEPAFYP